MEGVPPAGTDDAPLWRVERDGEVASVVMNRPPANAISAALLVGVVDALEELDADPGIRCIVLRSALERIWMAGADLGAMSTRIESTDAGGDTDAGAISRRLIRVERLGTPTIAAVSGHALGGGCELAMCCDYRVMVDNGRATIGLTETSLGLIPGAGGTQRLPRLVGRGAALKLILEARRLRAPEALAIGLVDAAPPPAGFEVAVNERAAALAAMPTRAFEAAKLAILDGMDTTLAEGLRIETEHFGRILMTDDAREGVSAFLEKRAPRFTGR